MEEKTISLLLDEDAISRIILLHNEEEKDPPNEYIAHFFSSKELTIAIFKKNHNGKFAVTFQGKKASYEASIFGYEESAKLPTLKEKIVRKGALSYPQIGSDEVGTGDYFGPIIVVAAYLNKEDLPLLEELGITDSKLLKDETILKVCPRLMKSIPYSYAILSPEKYNIQQEKGFNMSKIKAYLHNHVLLKLHKKYPDATIYQDQFAKENIYYHYLEDVKEVVENITFSTKGEKAFPSVAAASCIARYIFLKEMKKLSTLAEMDLPFGAGNEVDEAAKILFKRVKEEGIKRFVKWNFANSRKLSS